MKLGAAAQGRVTPISGLRSFTEASMRWLNRSRLLPVGRPCTPDTACAVPVEHLDETRKINDSELGTNPRIGARSTSTESERGAEVARIDHGHYYYAPGDHARRWTTYTAPTPDIPMQPTQPMPALTQGPTPTTTPTRQPPHPTHGDDTGHDLCVRDTSKRTVKKAPGRCVM